MTDRRGAGASTLDWQRELEWGSPEFERASNLARLSATEGSRAAIAKALANRDDRRALGAVLRAPVTTVRLRSDETAHLRKVVAVVGRSLFPNRQSQFGQFVLELPTSEAKYLAGRSRQALRTNLHHAARAEIKCERLAGYDEWRVLVEDIARRRPPSERRAFAAMRPPDPRHPVAMYAARDAYERPVAFAVTATFGDLAYVPLLLSAPDHPGSSPALWALNAFVAVDQASDEIRYLTVGSALRDGPGSQYLAHRLGYRVRNLRFVSRQTPARFAPWHRAS
jgi:hypothetical protein